MNQYSAGTSASRALGLGSDVSRDGILIANAVHYHFRARKDILPAFGASLGRPLDDCDQTSSSFNVSSDRSRRDTTDGSVNSQVRCQVSSQGKHVVLL